jgi:outer membrane protein assembly factor BamB
MTPPAVAIQRTQNSGGPPARRTPALSGTRASLGCRLWLAFAVAALQLPWPSPAKPPPPRLIAASEPDWPQFRGPRRDGICDERGLLTAWPEAGPTLMWTATNLGRGYSSPIISKGRLFITGEVGGDLRIFALDLQGRSLWQSTNGAAWTGQFPGARASVTYSDGRIYHQNAYGRLVCFDARNGRELWAVDLLARFGGQNITWALSDCVLVDQHAVYATPGGRETLLAAFDKRTGKLRWQSGPFFDSAGERDLESASYASSILVQFDRQRLLLGCSLRHLVCADADTGRIQWTQRMPTSYSVLAMMPVLVGDAVFVTAPHGQGGKLLQLLPPAAPTALVGVKELWTTRLDTLQGCVVHLDGKLFGSFYAGRKGWAALDAQTGAVLYDLPDVAKGSVLAAEGKLYALCEDGWMLLLESGEKAFAQRGRFRLADARSRDAWAHPVIHQGRLYLRYHETLYCYDIRAR